MHWRDRRCSKDWRRDDWRLRRVTSLLIRIDVEMSDDKPHLDRDSGDDAPRLSIDRRVTMLAVRFYTLNLRMTLLMEYEWAKDRVWSSVLSMVASQMIVCST